MATGMLYLNGQEAEATFGLIVVSFGGNLSVPARSSALLDVPGLPGGIDPGTPVRVGPRTLVVNFLVQASSYTTLYTTLDAIKAVCAKGLVKIVTPYDANRAIYGVMQSLDCEPLTPAVLNGWLRGAITFLCPDPYWYAVTPDTIAFTTTATEIPLGTAPSVGRDGFSALITITGAATTPTLTYADYNGNTVGTMIFSGYSPLAGDYITIDCGRRLVTKTVSGVTTNAFSALTAGYLFPALSPDDADYASSAFPTLKTDAGTGSITLYKAYT